MQQVEKSMKLSVRNQDLCEAAGTNVMRDSVMVSCRNSVMMVPEKVESCNFVNFVRGMRKQCNDVLPLLSTVCFQRFCSSKMVPKSIEGPLLRPSIILKVKIWELHPLG
jgi:hypothetical protein